MLQRLSFIPLFVLLLNGCSYDHGVRRVVELESPMTSFSCIFTTLQNLGYKIENQQSGLRYYNNKMPVSANFAYVQNNKEGLPRYNKKKLEHLVGLGSGPTSCDTAKIASAKMLKIESDLVGACSLKIVNIEENLMCSH